jgi:F-type H+-transporting ATPase subunit epsilon
MTHKLLKIKIITPEKTIYEGDITHVTIPTEDGEITVYANHTPLVGLLVPGELSLEKEEKFHEWFAVSTGIVEIRPDNEVVILADTSERASEIDIEKAKEARAKAEEAILKGGGMEDVSVSEFEKIVEWEMARIRAHEKRHSQMSSIESS